LEEALESERVPLEAHIKQLTERNEALNLEIAALREEVRKQNESLEQAVQAKEDEISDLSKQLQAALAPASSAANEAGQRSYSPASSPTEKERRSTASSSQSEGNNSYLYHTTTEEQHEHMTAAVADSCPISLASKLAPSNGVGQHVKTSSDDDNEAVRVKRTLSELESKVHLFQKKVRRAEWLHCVVVASGLTRYML